MSLLPTTSTASERAAHCLLALDEIKRLMLQGDDAWLSLGVQERVLDIESELYWIRGPKPRGESER